MLFGNIRLAAICGFHLSPISLSHSFGTKHRELPGKGSVVRVDLGQCETSLLLEELVLLTGASPRRVVVSRAARLPGGTRRLVIEGRQRTLSEKRATADVCLWPKVDAPFGDSRGSFRGV
jgi:hypothetical protein